LNFEVIGFGALNVDKLYSVDKIAGVGEERVVKNCVETAGGSAANTVVGLARLGHKVGYIGKVGDNREGKFLLRSFIDEKVDTKGVILSKGEMSGVVIGFVDSEGERSLYVNPGANNTLDFAEIDRDYANDAVFLHLSSFFGEKQFEIQKKIVRELKKTRVSFDPGHIYAGRGCDSLRQILKRSFVIFPNEQEIRLLTGEDFKRGAETLINKGANVVAVKLGQKGCYVINQKEKFLINAFKVNVIDTTGAGDAFCAGFLHGLLRGKDLYDCGRIANFVASRKIEKFGARAGLPLLSELPNR